MPANASAHKLRVRVGPDELNFDRQYTSFEVGRASRDSSGLLTTTGTLTLAVTKYPAPVATMNPRTAEGRALWHRGQLIKLQVTKSNGTWADHPCGWLYILAEPLPPYPGNPFLEIEVGCQLALRDFEQGDDQVAANVNGVNRTAAIAGCFAQCGVSNWVGEVNSYPIPFEVNKQGGSFMQLAGTIAWGGISLLWQNNQGQITNVSAAISLGTPVVELAIGHDEISYEPSEGGETPCERIVYAGAGSRTKANAETVSVASEDYGPASTVDPEAGNDPIVIRASVITESIAGGARHRTELVRAPLGIVSPVAFPKSTALGLDEYTDVAHAYEETPTGKLLTITTKQRRLYPAAMPEYFKRLSENDRNTLSTVDIFSKVAVDEYRYTDKDTVELVRSLVQEPIGAIVPEEDHEDAAVLIYTEVNGEGYQQPRKREIWKTDTAIQPLVKVKDITVDSPNARDRVRVKTALITSNNTTEISNAGQTTPPAAERKPEAYSLEEFQTEGVASFGTYPGSDLQERERTFTLEVGVVGAAQLAELAQIEGLLLIGRRQGQQIQAPLLDALIDNPEPLTLWTCQEPDGNIYCFQADSIQYTHERDKAVVGCNGIWIGTIEATEDDPTPSYSASAVTPPYNSVRLVEDAALVVPRPTTVYRPMIGGMRMGGTIKRYPYPLTGRTRPMIGGMRMGGGIRRMIYHDMVGGMRSGGTWNRTRSFRGGMRMGGPGPGDFSGGLLSGLIAFWNLNGDGTDEVGSAHLTADTGVTWVTGQVGQAAGFLGNLDGTEKLTVTDDALTMGSAITVAFIVKNIPLTTFIQRSTETDIEWGFFASISGGWANVTFFVRESDGSSSETTIDFSSTSLSDRTNTFLMIGWANGSEIGLELHEFETSQVATSTTPVSITLGGLSGATLQVGTGAMSSSNFFDAIGLWDLVLSSDDRDDLWNDGLGTEHPFE
ncbi:hypothetical protein [Pantanalinema sp. GBBB05]|uniref:hypothetical protein n=1 Tax=Pantanalinema sp. GBBB05 TaxID=2604139 RepID=UPI001D3E5053|nr:hypothetical protein [Pantanalinema sp. GBBB05]